jgi:hypothetical protein
MDQEEMNDEVRVAHLPRGKYRVVETDDGWDVFAVDDHGAFT